MSERHVAIDITLTDSEAKALVELIERNYCVDMKDQSAIDDLADTIRTAMINSPKYIVHIEHDSKQVLADRLICDFCDGEDSECIECDGTGLNLD